MNILENIKYYAATSESRIAIKSGDSVLTYKQLEEYSNRLAAWINRNLSSNKVPIVVYGHKNPYMVVCFLACVKSGRAYCPQDISIPDTRVMDTAECVNPEVIFKVEGDMDFDGYNVKNLDSIKKIIEEEQEEYLDWSVNLGSSKQDKEGKNFVNQAPFSFDLSVMDLYTSLACGGTLHTMTKKMQEDYNAMFEHFKQSDINVWVSTPSFADMCLSDRKFSGELIPNLEVFLFCGEVLTTATVSKLHQRFPKAKVINTYGPTESTVAVTDVEITPELLENIMSQGKSLPVGHEKKGTIIEIHGEQGEILEEGQQGEIIIIGDTVSTGYYKRDDLTKKAFFQCERNGIKYRAYHTGDAGYLKEGQLFYNGRIDLQVKLHGYRIEVEDIENNMLRLPQISHAVVLPNMKDGKVKSLTAFVTGDKGEKSDLEFSRQIKTELKEIIPAYMVPKKIKYVDNIPMNSNGKADRKYLGGLL